MTAVEKWGKYCFVEGVFQMMIPLATEEVDEETLVLVVGGAYHKETHYNGTEQQNNSPLF